MRRLRQSNPTGKSPPGCKNLSSPSKKNKSLAPSGKSTLSLPPSCPTRGALAIVANEGQVAVDAFGGRDERADAYGEIDWVRRPDAGVKLARSESFALAMVSQKAGSPG